MRDVTTADNRLRAANPVSSSDRLDTSGLPSADAVIARATNGTSLVLSGWPLRRGSVFFLVIVLFATVIAAAMAVAPQVISFFDSPPPEQPLKRVIFADAEGSPPGMDAGLLPEHARVVARMRVRDHDRALWVAPTSHGGMCFGWVGAEGGCDRLGTIPLDVFWVTTPDRKAIRAIHGFISSRYASKLEVELENGTTVRPLLVQVSAPIEASFFSYAANDNATSAGPVTVIALNDDGERISQQRAPLRRFGKANPLLDADLEARRQELTVTTADGQAQIWTAPTAYDGKCAWTQFAGRLWYLSYCKAAGYGYDPFSLQPLVGDHSVVIAGTLGRRFREAGILYADGTVERIRPERGFVLYAIPREHLVVGHQATALLAFDDSGNEARFTLGRPGRCFSALPRSVARTPERCPPTAIRPVVSP